MDTALVILAILETQIVQRQEPWPLPVPQDVHVTAFKAGERLLERGTQASTMSAGRRRPILASFYAPGWRIRIHNIDTLMR